MWGSLDPTKITGTASEFRVKFTRGWVEETGKIASGNLCNPYAKSEHSLSYELKKDGDVSTILPDSVDHIPPPIPGVLAEAGRRGEVTSPLRQGVAKGEKFEHGLINKVNEDNDPFLEDEFPEDTPKRSPHMLYSTLQNYPTALSPPPLKPKKTGLRQPMVVVDSRNYRYAIGVGRDKETLKGVRLTKGTRKVEKVANLKDIDDKRVGGEVFGPKRDSPAYSSKILAGAKTVKTKLFKEPIPAAPLLPPKPKLRASLREAKEELEKGGDDEKKSKFGSETAKSVKRKADLKIAKKLAEKASKSLAESKKVGVNISRKRAGAEKIVKRSVVAGTGRSNVMRPVNVDKGKNGSRPLGQLPPKRPKDGRQLEAAAVSLAGDKKVARVKKVPEEEDPSGREVGSVTKDSMRGGKPLEIEKPIEGRRKKRKRKILDGEDILRLTTVQATRVKYPESYELKKEDNVEMVKRETTRAPDSGVDNFLGRTSQKILTLLSPGLKCREHFDSSGTSVNPIVGYENETSNGQRDGDLSARKSFSGSILVSRLFYHEMTSGSESVLAPIFSPPFPKIMGKSKWSLKTKPGKKRFSQRTLQVGEIRGAAEKEGETLLEDQSGQNRKELELKVSPGLSHEVTVVKGERKGEGQDKMALEAEAEEDNVIAERLTPPGINNSEEHVSEQSRLAKDTTDNGKVEINLETLNSEKKQSVPQKSPNGSKKKSVKYAMDVIGQDEKRKEATDGVAQDKTKKLGSVNEAHEEVVVDSVRLADKSPSSSAPSKSSGKRRVYQGWNRNSLAQKIGPESNKFKNFMRNAKPSLKDNPRLNHKNKPFPTILYFETKILPSRAHVIPHCVELTAYERKLKRMFEDNDAGDEARPELFDLDLFQEVMNDKVRHSEGIHRENRNEDAILYNFDSGVASEVECIQDDSETILYPLPPHNSPKISLFELPRRVYRKMKKIKRNSWSRIQTN